MIKNKQTNNIIENFKAGINAILPIIILFIFISWAIKTIFKLIQPFVILLEPRTEEQTIFVKLAVLFLICFFILLVGAMLQDKKGKERFLKIENRIFKILPGYTMIKETILQFLGTKKMPFSQVALVKIYDSSTRQIAFITDEHEDGSFTVFVPTGPNPTSGNIFILTKEQVQLTNMPIEQAMKTIISCGIGSKPLANKQFKK